MSFALLFHYLLLNMFRMLAHPSSGACELFVDLYHGLYCSGSICVGVTVFYPHAGWRTSASGCITVPHHPSRTTPCSSDYSFVHNGSNTALLSVWDCSFSYTLRNNHETCKFEHCHLWSYKFLQNLLHVI